MATATMRRLVLICAALTLVFAAVTTARGQANALTAACVVAAVVGGLSARRWRS